MKGGEEQGKKEKITGLLKKHKSFHRGSLRFSDLDSSLRLYLSVLLISDPEECKSVLPGLSYI